jgi:hypothetical protein
MTSRTCIRLVQMDFMVTVLVQQLIEEVRKEISAVGTAEYG